AGSRPPRTTPHPATWINCAPRWPPAVLPRDRSGGAAPSAARERSHHRLGGARGRGEEEEDREEDSHTAQRTLFRHGEGTADRDRGGGARGRDHESRQGLLSARGLHEARPREVLLRRRRRRAARDRES